MFFKTFAHIGQINLKNNKVNINKKQITTTPNTISSTLNTCQKNRDLLFLKRVLQY
jgi:hypothetical protein